ncbi:hypothetical protein CAEBREN_16543 [Caenorhabditis brenneri]|uniref:Uncharacterized protein n=1 Tax=Caenorhabditis brenneri TaxID=135651 RepID=G0NGK0_CAEBE|nr:hypothetical protein CAEBREN_16543 [Caenorhabditis brenneri]
MIIRTDDLQRAILIFLNLKEIGQTFGNLEKCGFELRLTTLLVILLTTTMDFNRLAPHLRLNAMQPGQIPPGQQHLLGLQHAQQHAHLLQQQQQNRVMAGMGGGNARNVNGMPGQLPQLSTSTSSSR